APANLTYGSLSGIALVSDGTNVWAGIFDSSKNLQVNKWNGSSWGGWTVQESARPNAPGYLTGVYNGSNQILWTWTESNGSGDNNLMGSTMSTTGGGTSFTATPATIPQNHSGNITLTLAGTGTSWTSGSTVTINNSVTGTTTVTKHTWTQTSSTSATLTVSTAAGVGSYTITIDGVTSPSLNVVASSFTLSPRAGAPGTTPTITASGTNTLWTQSSPTGLFTVSGGSGSSISGISVTADTSATFTWTVGSTSATETVTDTSVTGSTATLSALVIYDLTNSSVY